MIQLTAAEIASMVDGEVVGEDATVTADVVTDSREAVPGGVFVAIRGESNDGHAFADAAVARGVAVVIAERTIANVTSVVVADSAAALGALARGVLKRLRERAKMSVVAITGSAGKTTTKDLLLQILGSHAPTVAPIRSFNNEIGLPLTVLRATEETRFLILEMGANHLGELTYLTSIAPPDIAVELMVGQAHLGEFGGIEAVAEAKSELVLGLAAGGTAVLNADDLRVRAMSALTAGPVVTFGHVTDADIRASDEIVRPDGGVDFTVTDHRTAQSAPVSLQLIGAHNVMNALAAASVGITLGLAVAAVAGALSSAKALSAHRMHVTERPDGVTIIDDSYNANPDSMKAALRTLAQRAARRRRTVAVLGEMLELGPESRAKHDEVGRLAVRLNISRTIVVGAGASGIFDGVTQEGSWGDEAVFVDTIRDARDLLQHELREGDVVLLKSSHGAGLWELADELAAGGVAE
ncbi:UDP-N-acetylmuramoyl-tripeptide--D-alanyl-D-alanine ligase [Rarobacter incanus]|uniref:UDP-N-acetylmuramoyl-tripeptide--D-alanyl-D-alanine ligase n=1 Tax=Rarobacter incanus TaxID=153494 RepID=A0A542SLJ4_9MICO|nr:UDP-N-acetylmuramoyl-tripeptide--D-alanyl-D-alanine ligase [Rarobacter incanus]TQK75493.1 UDP-N-acetylmuramoyl-tripeptide--D-alanyl-D-alanine ligase [Rarobacter incanus]